MRCPRRYADLILDDLRWLGLDWDGEVPYQSERGADLRNIRDRCCAARGCSTRASARGPRCTPRARRIFRTGAWCMPAPAAELTPASRLRRKAENTRPGNAGARAGRDRLVHGRGVRRVQREPGARSAGTFIIRRSDGVFAYQLAVSLWTTRLSGVTEVVPRELTCISCTPRQIWLHRLFGFAPPRVRPHPAAVRPWTGAGCASGTRTSTSAGCASGSPPEQVIGALAFAAHLTDRAAPASVRKLLQDFELVALSPRHELCLPPMFR